MSAMEQSVAYGPHYMTLEQELLRVLTAGDAARLEELLTRQDQTHSHVAVNVQAAAAAAAPLAVVAPPPLQGASCLLGVTSNGSTALHLAASRGHADVAALLCDCERAPSIVATRNRGLDTPLHCAAKAGHREVAARLLSAMRAGGEEAAAAALCARNCLGATALFEAVRHGHAAVVDLLMALAPELASVATDGGVSPLYLAATTDSLKMVRALLRPSQDGTPSPASFSGPAGRTALHAAAVRTDKRMAQEILTWEPEGPNLLLRVDASGRTPLHYAALYGRLEVVQLFLAVPTSVELAHIADSQGQFPLHCAAMKGNTSVLDELIKKCPDHHELVDDKGRNFLHCAVEHNQRAVVRRVCQDGNLSMLLNAMDYEGNTPLHLAAKYSFIRILIILLQTMAVQTSITNKDGLTSGGLGLRALERGRLHYALGPAYLASICLRSSGATRTLDGFHSQYVEQSPSSRREEGSEKADTPMTEPIASVLIATVAFAAAFTVPGGFSSYGTAILARRFAFRAFVVSNTTAFLFATAATCFLVYGTSSYSVPLNHRLRYNSLASGLVPVAAQFMIAAFAFGSHLVLGDANRGLVAFVYAWSSASVLFCVPGIWLPMYHALGRAISRRAGWGGLLNILGPPTDLPELIFKLFVQSYLFQNIRRSFFVLLICATFVVAMALEIALPNY